VALSEREKEAVKRRAGYRCEYCRITHWELQVDHIIPRSRRRRGPPAQPSEDIDRPENLAAACAHCNRLKDDFTTGPDPLSGRICSPTRDGRDARLEGASCEPYRQGEQIRFGDVQGEVRMRDEPLTSDTK
jgi:hypothetical protein